MRQEFRLILAVVLSAAVFFVYHSFFAPEPPLQTKNDQQQANQVGQSNQQKQVIQKKTIADVSDVDSVDLDKPTKGEIVAKEQEIVIETPVSNIVLSTRGGVLTSYLLKDFQLEAKEESPNKNLLKENPVSSALFLGFKGYSRFTQNKVFELVQDRTPKKDIREITLKWENKHIRIKKKFLFDFSHKDYTAVVAYSVENLSQIDLTVNPYLQNTIHQKEMPKKSGGILSFFKFERPNTFNMYYLEDKKLTSEENWQKFTGNLTSMGNVHWSGIADRYFLFALMPDPNKTNSILINFARKNDHIVNQLYNGEATLLPGRKIEGQFISYIGPKRMTELGAVSTELKRAVDYGWFSFLAVPILWLMTFLHKFIPSWGWVIIVLTFIVKLLLHPINKKSMKSMKAMQQLQPKMKEIKKKYADDKTKQQQEVMQLFKTHKVNPAGGCLPLLLQFPVYIALYKVLWNAIEIYHAPFMWIYADLSAPDPFYISPVLLGVFMFLQQKLTPTASTDPAQQKMMMIMPVMFTVFMLFLPVGLVIYIFVNTVMSVVQQYMMKRDISSRDLIKLVTRKLKKA